MCTLLPSYWAFLANPKKYRIDDAVQNLETDTWTTKGRPIHAGDRVIIWRASGDRGPRGIIALGVVISEPDLLSDVDNPYWLETPVSEERVLVRYYTALALPLWAGDTHYSLLRDLSVSRARGGTVFHVTEDQWNQITAALGGDPT